MPHVGGMPRKRVFGLVKGVDGARVLRSGRLVLLEPGESKPRKPVGEGEDGIVSNANNGSRRNPKGYSRSLGSVKGKENGWTHNSKPKEALAVASKAIPAAAPSRVLRSSTKGMFLNVYTRKRKRGSNADVGLVPESRDLLSGDVMNGIRASRRQRITSERPCCFSVILEGGFSCVNGLAQLLVSVLFYMKTVGLRLSLLGAFLLSKPVCSVFGSIGIRFSRDPPSNRIGVCKLFDAPQLVPLFDVDFSCIPFCFLYFHLHLVFRVKSLSFEHVNNFSDDDDDDNDDHPYDCLRYSEFDNAKNESSNRKASLQTADASRGKVAHPSVRASKLVGRSRQLRNNIGSHGIQKIRSSLRRKRAGGHIVGLQNASGCIVLGLPHSGRFFSCPVISKNGSVRSSVTTRSTANDKNPRINLELGTVKLRSTMAKLVQDSIKSKPASPKSRLVQDSVKSASASQKSSQVSVSSNNVLHKMAEDSVESNLALDKSELDSIESSSSSCSANLLVVEADRCYRIVGVTIVQEVSNSSDLVIVVKKDDRTFCSHSAQKSMKPCSFNRVSHDVIWSPDETWKLEFPNRQDWFIFKNLYKECSERNVPTSITTLKVIPVPGVQEVPDYENICSASFCRPDSYLSGNSSEVARALARKCANYDLDSGDEEWLNSFNYKSLVENESREILSEDKFELMIDTFEKAFYCNPDDFTDEKAAACLCKEIAEKEVVEVVYNYWMKQRKQKQSALLRVFQGHQRKRAQVIPKAAFRKRRSFKQQASVSRRGKQPSLWQGKLIGGRVNNYRYSWQGLLNLPAAMAADQDALQEQNAALDEAKESAKRCVESAIEKRQRAQLLMENANLAVYKAVMAIKIAESASCTGAAAADVIATYDIDWQM